jgi:hypothetical protein
MSQLVLEIGSTTIDILKNILEENLMGPTSSDVLTWQERDSMTYSRSDLPVSEVLRQLDEQLLASAVWKNGRSGVRYVLAFSPEFSINNLDLWLCTVEYTDETWTGLWDKLSEDPNVRFACVCEDEGLILTADQISPEMFPWSDSSLVVAGVRSKEGIWVSHQPLSS